MPVPHTTPPVIEVVSDVVCPWCFIGKRRLTKALALLDNPAVEVHWKPFELNPGAPKAGMDRAEYRARKFGSAAHARQLEERVAAVAASEGLDMAFDRIARVPNTFDAHRLIWLAGRQGVQDAVVEALFRAYFLDAEDVGDPAVLDRVASTHGLKLEADTGAESVRAEEQRARARGIDGVPAFFVAGQHLASGAQPPELLASLLAAAW
jgi:predicted DsbA family dithiol-disulfide isomerase